MAHNLLTGFNDVSPCVTLPLKTVKGGVCVGHVGSHVAAEPLNCRAPYGIGRGSKLTNRRSKVIILPGRHAVRNYVLINRSKLFISAPGHKVTSSYLMV